MIQILLDGLFTEKRSGIEKYIEKSGPASQVLLMTPSSSRDI
jgi:hypothetical protein